MNEESGGGAGGAAVRVKCDEHVSVEEKRCCASPASRVLISSVLIDDVFSVSFVFFCSTEITGPSDCGLTKYLQTHVVTEAPGFHPRVCRYRRFL